MNQRPTGYTLLEVMLVIAIIGVVAGVAIPLFENYGEKARIEELKSNILMVAAAQDRHFASRGRYTNLLTDLQGYGYKPVPGTVISIGVQITAHTGMGYWITGNANIDKNDENMNECWMFFGRSMPQPEQAIGGFLKLYDDRANAYGLSIPFVDRDVVCKK